MQTTQTPVLDNKAILTEAWRKTKGYKRTYWGALGMIVLAFLALSLLFLPINALVNDYLNGNSQSNLMDYLNYANKVSAQSWPDFLNTLNNTNAVATQSWSDFLITIIVKVFENLSRYLLLLPMLAGLWVITIKRSLLETIDSKMVFRYFSQAKSLLLGKILISCQIFLVMLIGMYIPKLLLNSFGLGSKGIVALFLLSILFSISIIIYIVFKYMWFIPIVAEKKCSAMEALKLSSNLFWQHKSKVFTLTTLATLPFLLVMFLCIPFVTLGSVGVLLSMIIMLVTGIWILPWYQLVNGILFREVSQLTSK